MIKSFQLDVTQKDAFEAANSLAKGSGLLRELYDDKTIEGLGRFENVQELLNGIKEFVDTSENEDKSLGMFLQEIALLTDADTKKDDGEEKVTMMTIHGSKGLEFKHVYIVGMEEDLFPSQMMLQSRSDLEEERRLFYVAITRAEKKLFLSYALSRYRFGRLKSCEPSRFLEEIDPACIKVMRNVARSNNQQSRNSQPSATSPNYARKFINSVKTKPVAKSHIPSKNFEPSDTSTLNEGMKVEHPKFGFGIVDNIDSQGSGRKAKVTFDNFGEKTLLLSFAKLKIHN